ncbi:uncharacterized protein RMCC_1415 [Mycolicibacterium canariasense]|uniref:Uncharacterized protein n=1 Tax=Mycolicibacterium canariasense TaxID=228230 RepID=A0A100WAD8_MYCCR|nr:hypothetical protein [Mycolicibacterium canariasense]MCV7208765.1 head decoration protein [Mycolicibacterium canariasense]ORV07167.1 hypothetical protein AWB94_14305 [Mycolicibacterium canariasense]GAS94449.1 uncharacterized protein RMCC_1415 [Mycolicibacterium canariasense]
MARKFLTGIDLQNQRGINAASPSAGTDLVNKDYVDNLIAGLSWKKAVDAATTANGALATAFAAGQVIDGVTLATGNRILIKNQTTGSENGIYTVNASGAPTRATDADGAGELVPNATVYVSAGTTQADTQWTCTTNGTITPGTTATVWAQTGGSGNYTAGNGINISSGVITAVAAPSGGLTVGASGIAIDTSVVTRKYATAIGDGSASVITVTHNLGTRDVDVVVYNATTYEEVEADVVHATTNTVTVSFAAAPASGAYRVAVFG